MTKNWLALLLTLTLVEPAAADEKLAARTDLAVAISPVRGQGSGPSSRLHVMLSSSSKKPVRVAWACACDRVNTGSHDYFRFIVRLGKLRREVEACDHSAEKRACRRCLPVYATLPPKGSNSFEWKLALRELLGRTGEAGVQVAYSAPGWTRPILSAPITVQVKDR